MTSGHLDHFLIKSIWSFYDPHRRACKALSEGHKQVAAVQFQKSRPLKDDYRITLVTKHFDTCELLLLLLAGVILFYLGWQFGRSSVMPPHAQQIPVYGRFGDLQQHGWTY